MTLGIIAALVRPSLDGPIEPAAVALIGLALALIGTRLRRRLARA